MNILDETLRRMPTRKYDSDYDFTSNHFAKEAKKLGLSQHEITNGIIANFLHVNAIQGSNRRRWKKRNGNNQIALGEIGPLGNSISEDLKTIKIEAAIKLLKANGYRVLKPISEWKEV